MVIIILEKRAIVKLSSSQGKSSISVADKAPTTTTSQGSPSGVKFIIKLIIKQVIKKARLPSRL
jgi:hypothetical protein